jgi:putative FmdB family regulatory protein
MPTYEYVCRSCGNHIEVYQRFSDAALTECGVCGGALRKVFHPAGILFKGSGFYATDSRRRSASTSGDGSSREESSGVKEKASSGSETSSGSGSGSGSGEKKSGSGASGTKEKSA